MATNDKAYANPDRCKGCYYCMNECPKKAISISGYVNSKGYEAIEVDQEKCIGCGICYTVCPDCVFEIR